MISWRPPVQSGVPVEYYHIEFKENPDDNWSHWGPLKETMFLGMPLTALIRLQLILPPHTARNLKPGHKYIIRVAAYSRMGNGRATPHYEFEIPGNSAAACTHDSSHPLSPPSIKARVLKIHPTKRLLPESSVESCSS